MISGPVVAPRSGESPEHLVILLHGYGADGEDLIGLAGPWGETVPRAMFAAPNAPSRCAQNAFGYEWFPIDFDDMRGSARLGVPVARQAIVDYLEETWSRTGLSAQQTVLAGFSQGAMMALHTGLSLPHRLAGIVSFSGALVPPDGFGEADGATPPICLIHGDSDPVVDPALTQEAAQALSAAGYDVTVHISPGMPHGIAADGLAVAMRRSHSWLSASTV